jgi:NitT/TauT family transport system substrate-binding protein
MGLVNTAEVLLARSKGVKVKIVAGYVGETAAKLYVKADTPYKTGKDLDGRNIGILALTHTSFRAVSYLNAKLNIKCEPVVLGSLSNNMAALNAGKIAAFYSSEGAASVLADAAEIRVLLSFADIYPKPYTAVAVWANESFIQKKPELVRAFVAAMLESVRYIKENPADASALLVTRLKLSKPAAAIVVAEQNKIFASSGRGSGADLFAAVEGTRRFTLESGFASVADIDTKEAVDGRFLPGQANRSPR